MWPSAWLGWTRAGTRIRTVEHAAHRHLRIRKGLCGARRQAVSARGVAQIDGELGGGLMKGGH